MLNVFVALRAREAALHTAQLLAVDKAEAQRKLEVGQVMDEAKCASQEGVKQQQQQPALSTVRLSNMPCA